MGIIKNVGSSSTVTVEAVAATGLCTGMSLTSRVWSPPCQWRCQAAGWRIHSSCLHRRDWRQPLLFPHQRTPLGTGHAWRSVHLSASWPRWRPAWGCKSTNVQPREALCKLFQHLALGLNTFINQELPNFHFKLFFFGGVGVCIFKCISKIQYLCIIMNTKNSASKCVSSS